MCAPISHKLTLMCLGILFIIMSLSLYIIWRSLMVTRAKRLAEEQARLRQEQLFQAANLVSGVAHEINKPVTSVMLNTPTLRKVWMAVLPILNEHCRNSGDFQVGGMRYSLLRDRIPLLLDNIGDGARRGREIVEDLKDFARERPSEMSDRVDAKICWSMSVRPYRTAGGSDIHGI